MKAQKQELNLKLNSILAMKATTKFKTSMIEALISQIKSTYSDKQKQGVQTCESEMPSEAIVCESEIEELQDRIMKKRSIKFQLNQQVQAAEDELYEIQKVIQTKRLCDDKMRRQIDKKMLLIEWSQQKEEKPKLVIEKQHKNKTLGNISMKFKNLFG